MRIHRQWVDVLAAAYRLGVLHAEGEPVRWEELSDPVKESWRIRAGRLVRLLDVADAVVIRLEEDADPRWLG